MEPDTITVRLLGGFSVGFDDLTLRSLPPQAVSLLSYLIVNRDRPQTRNLLAGRFWPELPDDRAKRRLSNSLWQIKKAATDAGMPELLDTTPSAVQVRDRFAVEVDAEDFERQLADFDRELRTRQLRGVLADRLAEVVNAYPGDFLDGHYDDWIDPIRDRIKDRYHTALVQLIQLYKSRSQYDTALRFATTLVKQAPLREDLHREVMRLHALLGQTPAAERQFAVCARVLKAELGVEPSAETVELIERIRTDAPSHLVRSQPPPSDARPLIGRAQELTVLLGRVDELLRGQGGVVLVEGDPGIGKTRLIEEFVEAADWRGVRILSAGHTGLSNMRPYETLREALATSVTGLRGEHLAEVVDPVWLQQAAEVLPELSRLVNGAGPARALRPEEEPTRMSEAMARVILAQGGLGPTLIVLEDIHWCDDDSMQVLSQLGGRLARSGVLLCLTYRRFEAEQSDSVWTGISKLEALPSGSRLVVNPLKGNEVRELIAVHIGPEGLAGPKLSQLVGETNGNPLYVLEAVRNPGVLGDDDEADDRLLSTLDLPASVVRSLETRVSALAPDVLTVLRALAAMAEPASTHMLTEIAGVDRRRALEALTLMSEQGFVADDDQGICRFSHEQTRRVVYELMPQDERRAMHERIADALATEEVQRPERLAHHARLAGRMADAQWWHLVSAREALAMNGYRTAAEHFGQADEAAQDLGVDLADRAKDLLAYEAALDVLGRRSEQTMLLKRLREVDLPLPVELELVEREVWLLLNTDEPEEAARLATEYAARAKDAGEPFVGLLTAVGVARYRSGDFRGAIEPATEALAAAVDIPSKIAAETILGKALVDLMDREAGERHLDNAAASADSVGDDRGKIEALSYKAVAQFRLGRYVDAEALFSAALQLSRSIGYRWGEGANLANLGTLNMAQGHGGLALDNFNAASDVFGSLGHGRGEAIVKTNAAELNHRLLGNDETALELASSAGVYFRSVGDQPSEAYPMCLVSSIDQRHGRRRLARRRLNDLLERAVATSDTPGEVEARRVLARIDIGGRDWRNAATHLDQILRLSEDHPLDAVVPEVLAYRARAAIQLGEPDEARQLVDRAVTLGRAGAKDAQVTAWVAGSVLDALGDAAAAERQFEQAHGLLSTALRGLPQELVDRAWSGVPEHLGIAEDYERRFVRVEEVEVPHRSAPMGRALRSEDFVSVSWTVSEPADWRIESLADRRKARIIRLVAEAEAQDGSVRIGDLAVALGVSERTIKRDIAQLRGGGSSLRTRKSS
ncbi:MAG: AAA family ATPase [Actinomycetota bacterium]